MTGNSTVLPTRYPHLVAGLGALVLLGAAMVGAGIIGRARIRAGIGALAPGAFAQKWQGEAVQREGFRHPELLPIYGSSELTVPMGNRSTEFFASAPTGFATLPVGERGSPPLSFVLRLGSLGQAVRGRKVVISSSGTWFELDSTSQDRAVFEGNYSALQAGDLMLRTPLPPELTRRIAIRLRSYPGAIGNDQLLRTAVSCIATRCGFAGLLPALRPLWLLRSFPMRVQDYVISARHIADPRGYAQRVPAQPDWDALEARADSLWPRLSASNQYGIRDGLWTRWRENLLARKGRNSDAQFLKNLAHSPRWEDFDILLATLQALGARPLVLNTPLKGAFLDYTGISPEARGRFYDRFAALTAKYGYPTRDFREYDEDRNFLGEPGSHLSLKGWILYDRVINAFYHDSIR